MFTITELFKELIEMVSNAKKLSLMQNKIKNCEFRFETKVLEHRCIISDNYISLNKLTMHARIQNIFHGGAEFRRIFKFFHEGGGGLGHISVILQCKFQKFEFFGGGGGASEPLSRDPPLDRCMLWVDKWMIAKLIIFPFDLICLCIVKTIYCSIRTAGADVYNTFLPALA